MAKLKITQIRSAIGRNNNQKQTLLSLGIRKIGQSVIKDENPIVFGMIDTVGHLVKVEKIIESSSLKENYGK
ncbi:MAG: 50S ribosomal protein L30 [Bifidobacteriaceae bacterium]|jgi:large subunit ribosomal protein L30|nr:50S ribosomal protein L30 [Bifidobacteriaceae bacterium]